MVPSEKEARGQMERFSAVPDSRASDLSDLRPPAAENVSAAPPAVRATAPARRYANSFFKNASPSAAKPSWLGSMWRQKHTAPASSTISGVKLSIARPPW